MIETEKVKDVIQKIYNSHKEMESVVKIKKIKQYRNYD